MSDEEKQKREQLRQERVHTAIRDIEILIHFYYPQGCFEQTKLLDMISDLEALKEHEPPATDRTTES